MGIAPAMTPNNEVMGGSSHGPSGRCRAVGSATITEIPVDLGAQVPETPAKRVAEKPESQRSATLKLLHAVGRRAPFAICDRRSWTAVAVRDPVRF